MKKKIGLLICVLVFTLGFTGCSKEQKDLSVETEDLEQVTETVITSFSQMTDEDFNKFIEGSDLEIGLTLMQSGLPVEKAEFIDMIHTWQTAIGECGAYVGHGEYQVETGNTGVILTTDAQFEHRDAQLKITFDEKLKMQSISVNTKFTTKEIFKKAGMNTLLGMGTVFIVLIFISFLISLFVYLPTGTKKGKKKKEEKLQGEPAIEIEPMALDDLELVAVIMAAIATVEGTSTDGFVVRSIKRRTTNKWN
ncbi:MAG: OadG family transporter subunit [Lachnospiraceae bacterium]